MVCIACLYRHVSSDALCDGDAADLGRDIRTVSTRRNTCRFRYSGHNGIHDSVALVAARMESTIDLCQAWSRGQAGIPLVRRCGYSVAAVDACDESDHILEFRDSFFLIPCLRSRARCALGRIEPPP